MRRLYAFSASLLLMTLVISSCSLTKPEEQVTSAPAAAETTAAPAAPPAVAPTAPPGTPKSDTLIDEALANGEIDEETALVYKVYAQFSDARLPAEYLGSADLSTDSHIIDQVQADFPDLSPETQALLIPYLVPPVYEGSWAPPAAGGSGGVTTIKLPCSKIQVDLWDSTTAMHAPVRFWWLKSRPEDAAIANRFITAMDDDIWPTLTGLMGRVPLPDEGAQCNGGGPEFDVYITPQISRSYAAAYFPPGCRETPSYIVMNPAVSDAILAHEFMHAIQWSYNTSLDCMYPGEYAWMAEATAAWAQNYVYPNDNEEHGYVEWFYGGGSGGQPPILTLKNDAHEYGTHLFFFYLTNHFGQPDIVKTAWDNTTAMDSVDALDQAIPGGLDAVWGDFAVENVIEPPYDEYQVWDQLNVKPSGSSLVRGQVATNTLYSVTDHIDHLSIKYNWYSFSEDVRLVTYFNGMTYQLDDEPINDYMGTLPINDGTTKYKFTPVDSDDVSGIKIQAYFKVRGDTDWQREDWTDKPYVSFCRDAQAEALTDLIIITSNSSQDQDVASQGQYESLLKTSDIGCWRYGGEASMLSTGEGEGGAYTDEQTVSYVAFERTDEHPDIPYPFIHFKVVEGQWGRTYDYQGVDNGCSGSGETSSSLQGTDGDLYILYGAVSGSSDRRYSGSANSNRSLTANFQCPDSSGSAPVQALPWFYADVLSQILEKSYTVPNGGKLEGSDDLLGVDNAGMLYEWNFEALFETGGSGDSQAGSEGSGTSSGTQGGTASGTGGDTPSTSPSASFPDVPEYPNTETSNMENTSGMLILTTSDEMEAVKAFYEEHFLGLGWQEGPVQGDSASGMIMLMFAKEPKMITIMISSDQGVTSIMINEMGK